MEGQERKGGEERRGSVDLRRAQVFSSLDCHHQGLCFLPQTQTHKHMQVSPDTHKAPRIPLLWICRHKGNKGPLNTAYV